jgi:TAG lipase/steryl ester hydrolase/phospholipase A2/LPA acyltransferase
MQQSTRQRRKALAAVRRRLEKAHDYAGWLAAAREHDALTDAAHWRGQEDSSLYDAVELRQRRDRLRELIAGREVHDLLYVLNEGIHGNLCGMGRPVLYARALSGTKHLIDDYVSAIVEALECIAAADERAVPRAEKVDFFRRASHCYGRSALMLSGGAGLIYFHHGVAQALIDEDLLPNVLSGASAGSWMCAQIGTRTIDELRRGHFDRFRYPLPYHLNAFRVMAGLEEQASSLTVKQLAMDSFANDMTFQEAYEHTGRYINISIASADRHHASRLMNAITSPNVYVRSAIDASSSVPGLVPPVTLYAKGADGKPKPYLPSQRWVDGSFAQDLPAKRLARLFGVNHYIVSMINPFALPFVRDTKSTPRKSLLDRAKPLARSLIRDGIELLDQYAARIGPSSLGPALLLAHALVDQDYVGDINIILPGEDYRLMNALFTYDGEAEIQALVDAGKRATWPKLAQVHNATVIARTLDEILFRLDAQEFGRRPGALPRMTVAS